jgi:uncharacterized protein YjbJ (UPF0337 family)
LGNAKDAVHQIRESHKQVAAEKADETRGKISDSIDEAKNAVSDTIQDLKKHHSA